MLQDKISLQTSSMVSSVHSTNKASARALSAINSKNISIGRCLSPQLVDIKDEKFLYAYVATEKRLSTEVL
jgi:hypothetical protein